MFFQNSVTCFGTVVALLCHKNGFSDYGIKYHFGPLPLQLDSTKTSTVLAYLRKFEFPRKNILFAVYVFG